MHAITVINRNSIRTAKSFLVWSKIDQSGTKCSYKTCTNKTSDEIILMLFLVTEYVNQNNGHTKQADWTNHFNQRIVNRVFRLSPNRNSLIETSSD
jgi:hypothetical protein